MHADRIKLEPYDQTLLHQHGYWRDNQRGLQRPHGFCSLDLADALIVQAEKASEGKDQNNGHVPSRWLVSDKERARMIQ